jgi:hypothetical protein
MDYIMVLNYKDQDYILLYGVGETDEFKAFVDSIDEKLWGVPKIE